VRKAMAILLSISIKAHESIPNPVQNMENVRTNKLRRNGHVEESAGIRKLVRLASPDVFKFPVQSVVTRITIKCIAHNLETFLNQ
jgi:hypothetical protein